MPIPSPSPAAWLLARVPLRWMFEGFYLFAGDPWSYWRSGFEQERYERAAALLAAGAPPGGWGSRVVLEVGCSVGAFTRRLADLRPRHLVAVDISRVALGRARRALGPALPCPVTLDRLDVFNHPLVGRFDLIVATDVLGYTDDEDVLARTRDRLLAGLAPGGRLLLGNTRLRARDGAGWEPFPSGFPRRGAGEILACFQAAGASATASYEEPRFRMDLLVRE